MADNIKITGNITDSTIISRYSQNDIRLISSQEIQEDFGSKNDYIEYYIYDAGGNLLNVNYNYKDFKSPSTSYINPSGSLPIIEIDPVNDLQNIGYSSGEFKVQYNFFNNKISSPKAELFLKEISQDRTEIRVGSTVLTNEQIEQAALSIINESTDSTYFVDYLINFGFNTQAVAVNIVLNKVDTGYEILFKLYQPLPSDIQEKVSLWVVNEKINPYSFNVNLDKLIIPAPLPQLKGPNFGIDIPNQNNIATSYQNYNNLIDSFKNVSTSSYQQLLSLMTSQSIDINTDYTNFSNFIFFSSAKTRISNFYGKIQNIEQYKNSIAVYTPLTSSRPNLINDYNIATSSINNIISQFDNFEYYLYFESGSTLTSSIEYDITPYPKSTSTKPYSLYPTSSTLVTSWYNFSTASADNYDNSNPNYIVNTLPSFIKEDDDNIPYITFVNMIGHYFDNIWVYLQAITDVNLANNNLEKGVSKDLVYYVLQSLGTKLYNQYGNSDNVSFLIGQSGSAYYTGSDTQAFTYTGSYLNTIPHKDLLAESYKRIYHNLPLLMKTKGTAYGLQTLVSTFGISNIPYSTSYDSYGSASYFNSTSSTGNGITSSIISIKEYGGDLKSGLLDEYNNDKIRVISGSIVTGSVLSPHISLQNLYTSSTQFRTNDSHYVDISFSPQEKINIFASASIAASASATWSLDDFIGDPGYQYSSSYTTLNTEKEKYYSPLSASIMPFTSTVGTGSIAATDYNSFIRLIQFFDNSLFKMLKDFIPARVNLSTGITISSPILERNKWTIANASNTSKINENDGNISGSTIKTEYTTLYTNLTGSKAAYYNGEITGSGVNVYNYFISGNFNPYLQPTSSLTTGSNVSSSLYAFNHSDFNVTLNNVSKSRISLVRKDIEYVYGTTGSITSSAELQDSYESLKTHQLSRYEGSKLYSLKYNNYTSASSDYSGDLSYGKTAVIDRNSVKLGLFTEITPNKFLPNRNNASLKYLVDVDGNFTELNQRNKHWEEVQNIFVTSNTGSISLFNNQLYGNQKTTNGEKPIFDSGYTYNPILYFTGSCSADSKIYFQNIEDPSSYLISAQNSGSPYFFINGGGALGNAFPLEANGKMRSIFNQEISDTNGVFDPGSPTATSASYTALDSGDYRLEASFDITLKIPLGGSGSYTLKLLKNGASIVEDTQTITILNEATASNSKTTLFSYQTVLAPTTVISNKPILLGGLNRPAGTTFTRWNTFFATSSFPVYPTCDFGGGSNEWYSLHNFGYMVNSTGCSGSVIDNMFSFDDDVYQIEDFNTPSGTQTKTVTISRPQSSPISLTKTDVLTLEFSQSYVSVNGGGSDYTASISQGNLEISSLAATTGYSNTTCPYFNSSSLSASIAAGGKATFITFNTALSNFHDNGYQFIPNPLTGSINSLYSSSATYGDVDYQFDISPYDMVVTYLSDNTYVESRIISSSLSGSYFQIHLDKEMSTLHRNNIMSGSYQRFLLLKKVKDETNVHLSFIKRAGKTSYGFLIPEDINQDVLNNIDTITKEAKQKLLNDQSVVSGSL